MFPYLSPILNGGHSFFKSRSQEEPQPSPTLQFLSEESPKTWVKYENYENNNSFFGYEREEDDYETPKSWINLEKQVEEEVFTPLDEEVIELSKKVFGCKPEKNSSKFISSSSHIGMVIKERSQGKLLTPQERCQLTINRVALEKMLALQEKHGVPKQDIRDRLQQAGINLNKYYDVNQENPRYCNCSRRTSIY